MRWEDFGKSNFERWMTVAKLFAICGFIFSVIFQ